jgi:hypothetical protein
MCRNDELSSTMSWIGCLLTDLELFILFAENSQILLKISVIPILLTLKSGSTEIVSEQPTQLIVQLNSSLLHMIVTKIFGFSTEIICFIYRKTEQYQNGSILMWLVDRQDYFGGYLLLKILTGMPKICICYGTLFGEANLYYS